jgi:chromate transporter
MDQSPSNRELFISFFKLGLTAFGGLAMVVHIRQFAVEKKQWLDDASFRAGLAICQAIPGATTMQTAAYVGLRARGVAGAAASFIGFGLPAFMIIVVLSVFYGHVWQLPAVVSLFKGLQVIVVGIVAHATFNFGKTCPKDWRSIFIAFAAAGMFGFGMNPVLVILTAALCGCGFRLNKPLFVSGTASAVRSYSLKPLLFILFFMVLTFILLYIYRKRLFDLATLMARIDLFAFGGGFTSLPLMFDEVVNRRAWMDSLTFLNGIALGQITPGPFILTATFIGYLRDGLPGALIATVFIFLPSFMILVAVVPYYDRLRSSPYFDRALQGISASFTGLLLALTIHFAVNIDWDVIRILLAGGSFVGLLMKVDLFSVVIIGTFISVLIL